jgi:hypothetical protein
MAVFDHIQNVVPLFGAPPVIILLLRISRKINKTTFAALQAGKRLFHKPVSLNFIFQ